MTEKILELETCIQTLVEDSKNVRAVDMALDATNSGSPVHCSVTVEKDLSQFLSISNSAEKLDDVTETMDSLFSSTLDTVAPLRLRKIKKMSPTPWYNEHTRALKRAARKMERSWKKKF